MRMQGGSGKKGRFVEWAVEKWEDNVKNRDLRCRVYREEERKMWDMKKGERGRGKKEKKWVEGEWENYVKNGRR